MKVIRMWARNRLISTPWVALLDWISILSEEYLAALKAKKRMARYQAGCLVMLEEPSKSYCKEDTARG